jgi:hypothetical protein
MPCFSIATLERRVPRDRMLDKSLNLHIAGRRWPTSFSALAVGGVNGVRSYGQGSSSFVARRAEHVNARFPSGGYSHRTVCAIGIMSRRASICVLCRRRLPDDSERGTKVAQAVHPSYRGDHERHMAAPHTTPRTFERLLMRNNQPRIYDFTDGVERSPR